jgi:hypothetical protein
VSSWQQTLAYELSGYVLSPLREGDIALYRGSGTSLSPILLVAAEETSPGCVERLEHEYALKSELGAGWVARPVALSHDNGRMTLVLEDPGGAPRVLREAQACRQSPVRSRGYSRCSKAA